MDPPPPDKKQKRRVPDSERQRTSTSCDRCKTRKIRCIRLAKGSGSGSNSTNSSTSTSTDAPGLTRPSSSSNSSSNSNINIEAPCAACVQLRLPCISSLPRKQRVYASYDQLKLRYRALDLLVRRLCPGEDVESVDEIRALAARRGVDLSDLSEGAGGVGGRDLDPIGEGEGEDGDGDEGGGGFDYGYGDGPGAGNGGNAGAGGNGNETVHRGGTGALYGNLHGNGHGHIPHLDHGATDLPLARPHHPQVQFSLPTVPRQTDQLSGSIQLLTIPEGALIPAPRGGFHYVGPASSYLFANTVRELVKKSSAHTFLFTNTFDRRSMRRQQRAEEFTSHNRQTALEAREEGHPVMAADDTSPMSMAAMSVHNGASPLAPLQYTPDARNGIVNPGAGTGQRSDDLPPRALADRLVNAFFDRVHADFTLFHRSTFQVRYESMWAVQDTEPGWLCTLYMVFVLGAQALEREGVSEAVSTQSRYLSLVIREGLQRLVLTASLLNTQALALLGLYQHNAGERNTAWLLLGHAARMAVSLGMQRDGADTPSGNGSGQAGSGSGTGTGSGSQFDFIVRNNRRIVWWTLYLYEQNLSFTLGRPSSTTTLDMSAQLPDDAVIDHSAAPPAYLAHAVKLGGISAKVKRFIASISPDYDKPERLLRTAEMAVQIDQLLLDWQAALPPHLKATAVFATPKHTRSALLLQAMYHHLRSTIGRPYLLCKVDQELGQRIVAPQIAALASSAIDAARDCLSVMLQLANAYGLEGELWYDYYYVHHASLVLSLPLLVSSDSPDKGIISTALNYAQQSRLSPTYRILINVSLQFAKIVGIGPTDDPSRPASPSGGGSMNGSGSGMGGGGVPQPFGFDDPTWMLPPARNQQLTLEQLLGLSPMPQTQGTSDMHNFGQTWGAEMGDIPWDFFSGMGQ